MPIDISYVDYNHKPIELYGNLVTDISSLGWKVKSAKFLISENRKRCLLGLDLQGAIGVKTNQSRPQEFLEVKKMTWWKHPPVGRIFIQTNTKTFSQELADQKITEYTQF